MNPRREIAFKAVILPVRRLDRELSLIADRACVAKRRQHRVSSSPPTPVGVAHGSASASTESAPRSNRSVTNSTRPQRHAHPSGVLLSRSSRTSSLAPASRRIVAKPMRSCGSHRRRARPGTRHVVQQRSSKAGRKIDAGSFKDHLEACQVTVALSLWMTSERLHEPPLPARITPGPLQVLERHLDELDVAAGGRGEEKLLGDGATRRHDALLQTAGGFVVEQPPQSLGQPEVAGRPCVHESTVTFQQLHHRSTPAGRTLRTSPSWRHRRWCWRSLPRFSRISAMAG